MTADKALRAGERITPAWLQGLGPKDFLFNGQKCSDERWELLDWSRARADFGPSPSGNLGPYWHVPWSYEGEELIARLYPKVLLSKWLLLIRRAIEELAGNDRVTPGAARRDG